MTDDGHVPAGNPVSAHKEPMMRSLIATSCIAASLVAAPLSAQTQSPGAAHPAPAASPVAPESRSSSGALREGERLGAPRERTIDEPADRPGGRISETAPSPRAGTGETRFRADLASCRAREPESQTSCRQEMSAARAQGLYRN
jgi:hypothetical protein